MHAETDTRVKVIRSRIAAGKAGLSKLQKRLGKSNKALQRLLLRASESFEDLETYFLRVLEKERAPIRSLGEELEIVNQAEFFLSRIAQPQLWVIEEMLAKFGPHSESRG